MKNRVHLGGVFVLAFLLGGISVYVSLKSNMHSDSLQASKTRERGTDYSIRQSGYTFINPLLECEISNTGDRMKYIPFEEITKQRIRKEIIDTNPDVEIGLYVRNLNNGPWFGINENTLYSPASLMKLPVLMTYLKWIEEDPKIANKKVIFHDTNSGSLQYFQPSTRMIEGKEYSVRELLEEMIVYSDNQSMHILLDAVPGEFYTKVSKDLGITVPGVRTPEDFLSVKDVATFFRILYNASYLDRDTSEYALSMLSRATFHEGLNLGVPDTIKIAHKFGERGYAGDSGKGSKQLHDCGIVYYAKYPYLACIVTKGDDFEKLSHVIGGVSKIVYEEISKAFP